MSLKPYNMAFVLSSVEAFGLCDASYYRDYGYFIYAVRQCSMVGHRWH